MSIVQLHTINAMLTSTVVTVRRQLNSYCPVNRLPPEILSTIFRHVPDDVQPEPSIWPTSMFECSDVHTITLVCGHWRNVALDTPFLWNSITDSFSPDLCLRRSRSIPLNLLVNRKTASFFRHLVLAAHPIRELHCKCWELSPSTFAMGPAPSLETLTLMWWAPSNDPPSQFIFQDATPKLRHLTLQSSKIPSNSFSGLKQLHLSDCYASLSSIHLLLMASSDLQDLTLLSIGVSDQDMPVLQKADLGHLRSLVMRWLEPDSAHAIFSCISIPPAVAIHISVDNGGVVIPKSHATFDLTKLAISIPRDEWDGSYRVVIAGPVSAIYTGIFTCMELPSSWQSDLSEQFPLHQIEELWIEPHLGGYGWSSLHVLLRALTGLITLAIHNEDSRDICDQLVESEEALLFPSLATLYLLVDGNGLHNGAHVHDFVASRAALGHPLQKVVVEFTHGPLDGDHIVNSLSPYVPNVELRPVEELSRISLPAICSTRLHKYWTPWDEQLCADSGAGRAQQRTDVEDLEYLEWDDAT
ncbi:hypothetical protein OBBRIDRAFT_610502 [Obba rivulosa]|uniref:F-box domain-containing protein n=1 Tax=Obba rivulosa TaxID=1052685 RepID=A0A8E2DNL3_9APHY|nr:hypothetical protein OBBRIDRAFT_610502 [Obba rivulosa]